MSDHYCCKRCGLRYDCCKCPTMADLLAKKREPTSIEVTGRHKLRDLMSLLETLEHAFGNVDVTVYAGYNNVELIIHD